LDLIELRKLILGINETLPDNGSWKFVDASTTLTTTNPWIYSETRTIADLTTDMSGEDFIGVKIGDVNASVELGAISNQEADTRRANKVEIIFSDRMVEVGEQVEIVLETERTDVYGFQFTMELTGLELITVQGENIGEEHVGVHGNKMTMSYGQLSSMASGEMMTMKYKATMAGQLSEMLRLSNSITRSEAYTGTNLEEVNIELRGGEEAGNFELYQNEPNPFAMETVIGFDLPEAGQATLSLFDVTGKVIRVVEGDYAKGYNAIKLSKADLNNTTGMIYYKLQTNEHTATRHMIMIE